MEVPGHTDFYMVHYAPIAQIQYAPDCYWAWWAAWLERGGGVADQIT